jgi:hypothetical protein
MVVSHDAMKFVLRPFLLQQISILAQGCDVVGIDEAGFLMMKLSRFVRSYQGIQ